MSTILMNSENSKTSDPDRLLLNLTDKIKGKNLKILSPKPMLQRCKVQQ